MEYRFSIRNSTGHQQHLIKSTQTQITSFYIICNIVSRKPLRKLKGNPIKLGTLTMCLVFTAHFPKSMNNHIIITLFIFSAITPNPDINISLDNSPKDGFIITEITCSLIEKTLVLIPSRTLHESHAHQPTRNFNQSLNRQENRGRVDHKPHIAGRYLSLLPPASFQSPCVSTQSCILT